MTDENILDLEEATQACCAYFESFLRKRFHTEQGGDTPSMSDRPFDDLCSMIRIHLNREHLEEAEVFLLTLALIPHIDPVMLDRLFGEILGEGDFPQLGGLRGKQHRGILPTGETALFLLAGEDPAQRMQIRKSCLSPHHWLFQELVLSIEPALPGEPPLSGKLLMHPEYVELFTTGKVSPPVFSMAFPAQRVSSRMDWEDLVLNARTLQKVRELEAWVYHGKTLLEDWQMNKRLKPGYRCLFHGPSGTGKTLTAALLGKSTGKEVFKVDLSMVVSKYIGETEKNLASLFEKAEHKNWILFFDEADALFGKRTGVRDAHDKYANQEVSYLLQRVETYDGLVILASNLKKNIDEAFIRRFQSIIYFPKPSVSERFQLWERAFPVFAKDRFTKDVDLGAIARQHELTGAEITNIVQHVCLQALSAGGESGIVQADLIQSIQREMEKSA